MAKNTIWDLSQTHTDNTDIGGQPTTGSANANTIDSMLQKFAAVLAGFAAELGGTGTVGGTADAITLTTSASYPISALTNGTVVALKAASNVTGASTLNVDGKGAKAIRLNGDTDTQANDIIADGVYLLRYDTAYNSAAGAWVLLNPTVSSSISAASTTEALTGTDTSKYITADALAALWEKGSDIASAGTISIGEGGFYHITGTTTITDIDWATAKNGRGAWVIFDGALTLTHNATTLKLPTAANITTVAGDRAYFVQDSSDNVVCLLYQRADGSPLSSSSSMTLLETLTTTGAATVTSSAIASSYRSVYVEMQISSTDNTGDTVQIGGSTNGSAFSLGSLFTIDAGGASTTSRAAFQVHGIQIASGVKGATGWYDSVANGTINGNVSQNTSGALTHLRFGLADGTIDVCNIAIYGVK